MKLKPVNSVRRYYIDSFFSENIKLFNDNAHILDIGGKKNNKRGLFDIRNYDLNVQYCNIDGKDEPDYLCDAANIPVEPDSYDGIILAEVLEHVPHPLEVLQEAYRILKPEGTMLITVPFLFPIHADPHDYCRYTDSWLKKYLNETGFKEIKIEFQGTYWSVLANMYSLRATEYAKKASWRKLRFTNIFLKWFYQYKATRNFAKESRQNIMDFEKAYTTGFGIVCGKK